jgi:hypothetical protein
MLSLMEYLNTTINQSIDQKISYINQSINGSLNQSSYQLHQSINQATDQLHQCLKIPWILIFSKTLLQLSNVKKTQIYVPFGLMRGVLAPWRGLSLPVDLQDLEDLS